MFSAREIAFPESPLRDSPLRDSRYFRRCGTPMGITPFVPTGKLFPVSESLSVATAAVSREERHANRGAVDDGLAHGGSYRSPLGSPRPPGDASGRIRRH